MREAEVVVLGCGKSGPGARADQSTSFLKWTFCPSPHLSKKNSDDVFQIPAIIDVSSDESS